MKKTQTNATNVSASPDPVNLKIYMKKRRTDEPAKSKQRTTGATNVVRTRKAKEKNPMKSQLKHGSKSLDFCRNDISVDMYYPMIDRFPLYKEVRVNFCNFCLHLAQM